MQQYISKNGLSHFRDNLSNNLLNNLSAFGTIKKKHIFLFISIEPFSLSAEVQRSQLLTEPWFHASISRQAAEALLKHDGDFLVRESQGKPGQYVLTGLQGQIPKHLLLFDPEGTVSVIAYTFYFRLLIEMN